MHLVEEATGARLRIPPAVLCRDNGVARVRRPTGDRHPLWPHEWRVVVGRHVGPNLAEKNHPSRASSVVHSSEGPFVLSEEPNPDDMSTVREVPTARKGAVGKLKRSRYEDMGPSLGDLSSDMAARLGCERPG